MEPTSTIALEPLEDSSGDILCKAIHGLKLSPTEVATRSQLSLKHVNALLNNKGDASSLHLVADALHLHPVRLLAIHRNKYHPRVLDLPQDWCRFQTNFGNTLVNSYLIWDPASGYASAFDTGADASGLFNCLAKHHLQLKYLFLTHTHSDHICELDRIVEKTGATVWVGEKLHGAQNCCPGQVFSMGIFHIEARLTRGHSPLGMSYVIRSQQCSIAFVGDALFAGSIGMPNFSYQDALQTCALSIFSLPGHTILCPGHGPLTSVRKEKSSNPFFPEAVFTNGAFFSYITQCVA